MASLLAGRMVPELPSSAGPPALLTNCLCLPAAATCSPPGSPAHRTRSTRSLEASWPVGGGRAVPCGAPICSRSLPPSLPQSPQKQKLQPSLLTPQNERLSDPSLCHRRTTLMSLKDYKHLTRASAFQPQRCNFPRIQGSE